MPGLSFDRSDRASYRSLTNKGVQLSGVMFSISNVMRDRAEHQVFFEEILEKFLIADRLLSEA
jgi:hypothetical protein